MKISLLAFLVPVVLLGFLDSIISCNQTPKAKQVKNDTLLMEALYVTDGSTLQPTAGPVKRVIMMMDYVDSSNDEKKIKKRLDTIYLLPNRDTSLYLIDSLRKPILLNGQKQYGTSFKNPLYLNKAFVFPTTITFPNIH